MGLSWKKKKRPLMWSAACSTQLKDVAGEVGQGEQNQRPSKCLDYAQTTAVGSLCRDRIWVALLKKFHVVSDNLHHPTTGRVLFAVNTKDTQHTILDIFPGEE